MTPYTYTQASSGSERQPLMLEQGRGIEFNKFAENCAQCQENMSMLIFLSQNPILLLYLYFVLLTWGFSYLDMCDMKCLQYSSRSLARLLPLPFNGSPSSNQPNPTKAFIRTIVWGGGSLLKNKRIGTHVRFLLFSRVKSVVYMGKGEDLEEEDFFNSVPGGGRALYPFSAALARDLRGKGKRNLNDTTLHSPPFFAGKLSSFFCLCGKKRHWQYPCHKITKKNSPNHKMQGFALKNELAFRRHLAKS